MEFNFVVLAGVLIGVFLRTVGPYLMALSKGEVPFDWKYLRSAFIGAVTGCLAGGFALPAVAPDAPWQTALWLGITTGYALQSATRHVEKRVNGG